MSERAMITSATDLLKLDERSWQRYRFDEIACNISERVEPQQTDLEIYVGLEHLDPETVHIKRWGTPADVEGTKLKVYSGDVIFGKRRAYQRKAAVAHFEGICSAHAMVLRANPEVIAPDLFPFFLHSDAFMHRAVDISVGSLSPTINWKTLAVQEFLLPPREEQAKLAELLWAADEVVEKQVSVQSRLTNSQDVFALNNYKDDKQPLQTLSSIAEVNPRAGKNGKDELLDVTFLTMADVSEDGHILNRQTRKLKEVKKGFTAFLEGDTLFAKITPCMENGKGALATELTNAIGYGSTEFHVIRPKSSSDRLFCFFLSQMNFLRTEAEKVMVGSAGQKRVPSDFLEDFSFRIPNENTRKQFGETMLAFEERKTQIKEAINRTKRLKQSLTNQFFS